MINLKSIHDEILSLKRQRLVLIVLNILFLAIITAMAYNNRVLNHIYVIDDKCEVTPVVEYVNDLPPLPNKGV